MSGNTPAIDRAVRAFDTVVAIVACAAAGTMTLLVAGEVFARYVLDTSLPFSNELSRALFMWTVFIGLPLALGRGRHVAIELLDQLLPASLGAVAFRASCAISIVLLSIVCYRSAQLAARNWDQTLNTIPVTAGVFYLPIPIGIGIAVVYLALMLWTARRQLIVDDEAQEDTP